ncbi:hypothetical protein CH17P1_00010 [Hungatella phage CH17P1]|jgi:hypothetical protein|nr:hypothetical protein CH17P1_00010 [Hungatella phage CH17P1]
MAKADFTRTIITNTIKVAEVKVDNGAVITTELLPIVKVGTTKLSPEKALKIAKAEYKNVMAVIVLEIESVEEVRGMSFETFMTYSEPVERPASQR